MKAIRCNNQREQFGVDPKKKKNNNLDPADLNKFYLLLD